VDDEKKMCEECGQRPATWHLTDLVGGKPVQHHLCEECYAKKYGVKLGQSHVTLAQLLAALAPELKEMAGTRCPVCGLSYLEFRQSQRLGCPNDYEAFKAPLEKLLEQVHGSTRHCGKVPPRAGKEAALRSEMRLLKKQQERAIAAQDYELAARLRDRIRQIQEQTHGPQEPDG